jgi:hypothetical protein
MPHAAAGLHPLDAACGQDACRAVGVFVGDAAFGKVGKGGNAGMRMQSEAFAGDSLVVEEIKEDERLQELSEVGRAHQTGDRSFAVTAGAPGDLSDRALRRASGDRRRKGHWGLLGFFRPKRSRTGSSEELRVHVNPEHP